MQLNSYPHGTEEYYCINCDIQRKQTEVFKDWKCPDCNNAVHVRVKTDEKDNACFRVKIRELTNNDYILLHRDDEFRKILNLKEEGKNFRVAIEQYKTITVDKDTHILKLDGSWCH